MKKSFFFFFVAIILNSCSNGQVTSEKLKLSSTEFQQQIKATDNAVIIDVRTPAEFEKGHIANAVNINWNNDDFDGQINKLDKKKAVFVYCLSGGRSGSAAKKMREIGFERVYEMPGGMMEWRASGLPENNAIAAQPENGMSMEQYESLLNPEKLVLVDFYAEWCGPCKKMKPYLEKIANQMTREVTLIRIDVDQNPDLSKKLDLKSIPVLKLYKKGDLVWTNVGYIEELAVKKELKKHAIQ